METIKVKSIIYCEDSIFNDNERSFGESDLYMATMVEIKGDLKPALFTPNEINKAILRAKRKSDDFEIKEKKFLDLF